MENLESKALDSAAQLGIAPRLWKRYVDDVFSLIKRQNVDAFLQHLNDQDGNIRFTTEAEVEHRLPFLDVAVTRRDSGRLMTGVHRKPTRTDQVLAFVSHHPAKGRLL